MPKYKVNGRTFNIPDNEVDLFEADFPEAQLHYQTNDGRKFMIYANERKDFLSDFPDATELGWSETIKEQAKQADPFQPEDNLAQPMYGSMSYQDNIGKPEDSLYYPSPLSDEGRADYEPISAEERSKQEYDMLMRQLNDFDAQNGDFMDTYEAYEKAAKHQVNEGGFALDTMEREYVNANSNDYHLRKQERDALNERIRNNSYFNQMRMAEADAANETVDAISNLMAQNEAENTELHKKMKAMNALAMNPRGSFGGFSKTKEMQDYVDERDDLLTAKRLYENTAQVYAAPINDGEDILKKFGQGFVQRGDDLDFWTMGIVGIADDMNARAAFQKIQDKFGSVKEFANLTDAEIDALLTPSEQLLISAVMDNNAAQYARMDNTAGAYKAGAGAADSLMFMAQFLLTGGVGDAATIGTAAHKRLVNWLGRKVGSMSNGLMKDVARGAVKLGVGTAESIGKALVMTPLMPHTYANIADKIMSFDDNGELMDVTDAILTGAADALIETWSESTGDFVNKILGVPGGITKGIAKKALKNVDFSDWGKAMNAPMMKILKKGGFNGFLGEMGEEFIGNAVRSISGLDPDAFKEFTKLENLLVTAGSFAPMTIFGLGTSSAQYGLAKRKLDNAQKAFESMLRDASHTEDQVKYIVDELLGSTDAHLTPERLVANFSPLLRELAFNDRYANNRTQTMQAAVDFMWQIARYRTFDGVYHRQEEQQRNDMLAEIQEGTGREFWTTRLSENAGLDGTAYETNEVRAVEFNDGRVAYVLGGDGVNNTVVYNDGQTGFLSEEQLNEGKANGSIVSDATMSLNDYLTQQVARVRMTEEEQRMFTERNTNIGQVRAQFPIDATVELGTTEAPIQGVVRQQTPNGVIVESPAGISQLTWEELGHTIGVEVNPQTDAQMEEEAINNLEIADLQRRRTREQRRAQRNTAAEAALEAEQMVDEAENEGLEKPIPMKADGTVDQTAFWNESPARWAQWKTEQRQDGGAYASTYIQNAIGILEGQIAESEAAFLAESDFDAKDALEQTINQQKARLAELQDLSMQYMPSVIPAETSAEATAEQTQPGAETSQPAAVMADRQKFELDAEYQRRLSLAKALAEKEMILKEYFEAISAGSMEAVVMNKQNYKQIMKENGCDEAAIEMVTNAIKFAEEENKAVDALHVNDKIFIVSEYITSIEGGRVSYVHERQHNITKNLPELVQRILSLGLGRETMQKIVRMLSGSEFYENKSDEVLADEILSFTMEIAYTFDDFSVTLSKLGIPIELINLINEINDEQRKNFTLVNARRNSNALDSRQRDGGQNDGDSGEVSGGILGQEGVRPSEDSERRDETGEIGEPATGGAEASEEGLQVPVAEVDEESEEEPEGPDFRVTKPENNLSDETKQELADKGLVMDGGAIMSEDYAKLKRETGYETPIERNTDLDDLRFSYGTRHAHIANYRQHPEAEKRVVALLERLAERISMNELVYGVMSTATNHKYVERGTGIYAGPLRENVEYVITFDLDTTCPRTFQYLNFVKRIEKRIRRPLTQTECIQLIEMMRMYGQQIPCVYCYAENKRQALKDGYTRFMNARYAVLSAETDEEALQYMYGRNDSGSSDPKEVLTKAAHKVFLQWRKDRKSLYNPSMKTLWSQYTFDRNCILSLLDTMYEQKGITTDASDATITNSVAAELGVTSAKAKNVIEEIVGEWKWDTIEGKEHDDFTPIDEEDWGVNERAFEVWRDMTNYAKSMSSAKGVIRYTPYTDELKYVSQEDRDYVNGMGGVRMHSTNDFRIDYVFDYFQFMADMALYKMFGHTYTKSPEFVRIFGKSGYKINMSIAAYQDENGNIRPNADEGFDWEEAKALRAMFPNAGVMLMATSDEQIQMALDSDWIDMIIPFHNSGLPRSVWYNMRLWSDYQNIQKEKFYNTEYKTAALKADGVIVPKKAKADEIDKLYNEHFGIEVIYDKTGKRIAPHFLPGPTIVDGNEIPGHNNDHQTYLDLCRRYGVKPRFLGMQVRDNTPEGGGRVIDITEHPRYMILVKETARTDTPQTPIQFNFDEPSDALGGRTPLEYAFDELEARVMAESELEGEQVTDIYNSLKKDQFGIVDQFIDTIIKHKEETGKDYPLDYITPQSRKWFLVERKALEEAFKDVETIPYHRNEYDEQGNLTKGEGLEREEVIDLVEEARKADLRHRMSSENTLVPGHKKGQPMLSDAEMMADAVSFRITKNTRATIESWCDKAGLDEDIKIGFVDHLEFTFDDATEQLCAAKWYLSGKINLPNEDEYKVRDAVKVAKRNKVDALSYESPMDILNTFGQPKEKVKPINPDNVPTLKNRTEVPGTDIVIYDVEESEESRENMREIINTHYGKNASPWCLLQGNEDGKLTKLSAEYWQRYSAYPKQVAFKDGRLLAFSANSEKNVTWWDRLDKPFEGIPVMVKLNDAQNRRASSVINPKTGKQIRIADVHKRIEKDGYTIIKNWDGIDGPMLNAQKRKNEALIAQFNRYTKEDFATNLQYWFAGRPNGLDQVYTQEKTISFSPNGELEAYYVEGYRLSYNRSGSATWLITTRTPVIQEYGFNRKGKLVSFFSGTELITNRKRLAEVEVPDEYKALVGRNSKSFMAEAEQLIIEAGLAEAYEESSIRFRVTAEQDKAYMEAVKAGDMETAQRMVDEAAEAAGYTIRGDHGRVSKFTIFDRDKANPEGNWGQGFYFTNNEEDVEENYATVDGPDLEAKIEREVEKRVGIAEMNEEFNEDGEVDEFAIREEVEKEFITSEPNIVHAAIKMDKPFVVGHGMVVSDEAGNTSYDMQETYLDVEYEYDEDGEIDYYSEPTGTLIDLINALNEEISNYDWANFNANEILQDAYDGMTASQFESAARELLNSHIDELVNDRGDAMTSEILRAAIEKAGFDGIIDNTVNQKFGTQRRYGQSMAGMDSDTRHYISFDSSNIKDTDPVTYDDEGNVIPLSQRFNPENSDIRFRFTPRTDEQREQLFDKAKAHYGLTNNFNASGYMLPDGSLLDFSEANDGGDPNRRSLDHRDIEGLIMDEGKEYDSRYHYVVDFVDEGAIRMLPEAAGFQLSVPPTAEQRSKLMDYIYKHNGEVIMEITDENGGPRVYMEYNKRTSPSRIFRDMDGYFNEGVVPGIPPIRFRMSNEKQAIFVSNAAKAVEGIKQEKATPEQWLKMIEKAGGLKAGEDKWMGLSDWLKASDKKTLTKAEVLDFINENMIIIEEQHYGEFSEEESERALFENLINEKGEEFADSFIGKAFIYEEGPRGPYLVMEDAREAARLYRLDTGKEMAMERGVWLRKDEVTLKEWANAIIAKSSEIEGAREIDSTRKLYSTEGLENKHEIALTVPTIEPWKKSKENTIHFEDAGEGRAVAWIRFGDAVTEDDNRVLVVDEIQSARHQEGREKGYANMTQEQYSAQMNEKYDTQYYGWQDKATPEEWETYRSLAKAIPAAPFENNWHELAMKRMLRYAAENGYDHIAWTTGDQQAERYKEDYKEVTVSQWKTYDTTKKRSVHILFNDGGTLDLGVNDEGVVTRGDFVGENLSEVLGKEFARKILSIEGEAKLSGEELDFGEGMKGFYDKMLPAFMNKYGKKWGVKVEDIDLPNLENGLTMHSIPVTEEMKTSVMEGQVMFRMRGENESARDFVQSVTSEMQYAYPSIPTINVEDVTPEVAKKYGYTFDELKETSGLYLVDDKLIIIFAHEDIENEYQVKGSVYHESTHWVIKTSKLSTRIGKFFWDNADRTEFFKELKDFISETYDEKDWHEEMMCFVLSGVMIDGAINETKVALPQALRDDFSIILNNIGYGRERKRSRITWKNTPAKDGGKSAAERGLGMEAEKGQRNIEEGLRFRTTEITPEVQEEMDAIHASAIVMGNFMKAPNGQPTNLTEEQWLMVRTKGFKAWFGDWENDPENASKVVDENGEPKVVYHGTPWNPLEEPAGKAVFKSGWFTGMKNRARGYGEPVAVFLNIKNPAYSYDKGKENDTILPENFDLNNTSSFGEFDGFISYIDYPEVPRISEIAKRRIVIMNPENYEDVIKQRLAEKPRGRQFFSVIPKEVNQIKSATDNTGEFSKENDDIRFRMTDSKGNTLTPEQERFFANSKAVDKDGNLLVLYHGTPRAGFTEFKSGFFTTSKEDAISYSGDRKGRLFDPNEKYEPETLTAGDFHLGYMTFDSEADRAAFLERFPYAEDVMSEREYEETRMGAEDEEYDALTARRKEFAEVWNAYREYERERFVDTTIGDLLANPEAYTEEDLMRAMMEYDSNASFDNLDDMSAEERRDALVSALQNANEETEGGILDMVVPTRVPRNGEGQKHNDLGNRTYEVYANVENPYEIDANGRGSEFESGDVYRAIEEGLASEEYDGVIVRNWRTGRHQQLGDVVIPKNGSQIKLTSNENPTESSDIQFRITESGEGDIRFSIRTKPAPKNVKKAVKLFNVDKKGNPHALFIDGSTSLDREVWLDADSPLIKDLEKLEPGYTYLVDKDGNAEQKHYKNKQKSPSKAEVEEATANGSRYILVGQYANGKKSYHNWGINGSGQVSKFAMRPGWHLTDSPSARHIGEERNPDKKEEAMYRRPNQRWFWVEYAADVDYNEEAASNPTKDIQTHIPEDGYYSFKTNTNANDVNQNWIISGSIRILDPLSREEVRRENEKNGVPDDLDYKDEVSFRVTGTPTEDVVAEGVSLSPAQLASLAGDIFAALPEDVRKKITDGLNGNILGLQDAILQIPTSLATKENWNDEDRQMAEVVADQMTKAVGIEMTRPFSASEALWTLYNAVNKSTDLVSEASRALVKRNLGFDSQTLEMEKGARDGVRFRTVGNASANASASMYNRGAANVWTRLKESFVDMNASVEKLVKAIEKRSGKVAQGFENVLMALNQQSSKGLAAMEAYEQKFLNKMFDEIRWIMDKTGFKYEDIVRYVILKHGLERNEKMAQRDAKAHYQEIYDDIIAKIKGMNPAQKRTYLTNAQLRDADAKAELARLQGVNTSALTPDQLRDHKKELAKAKKEASEAAEHLVKAQKVATLTEQDAQDELDKIFKKIEKGTDSVYKEMRKNDYSGISSMFYDTLGVDRKNYATEEEYQSALMQAKADKYDNLGDIEGAAQMEVTLFENTIQTNNLWKSINKATKETLRQQYEANMISKDQYLNLRDMFEFYVPLRGFADNTAEDMYTYYRKPNSTGYTKPILGAEGRKTEAESPFGWIAAMAGSAIASNVKNEAKLALYYFVANRPDNGIATLSKTWFVHTPGDVDANGKKIFRPAYPPFSEDLSSASAKADYEIWQANMRNLQAQGLAYEAGQRLNLGNSVVNISDTNKPEHIVNVKVGGKDYTIVINGNPRAAQAINGDLNIESSAQDYSSVFGPMLRWMSSVNTSYNPEFWITNMMRDMAFTMMAVNIKEDPAYRRKFFKNYAKAFKVISMVAKNEKGTLGNSYIERMYKDFVKYGGVTGYTQIKDSETWEKEIENHLASNDPSSLRNGKIMRGMKSFFHGAHRFGESLEQVSRFAAFLTALESGKSINEAINDAKEITVNFNRKGSGKMITLEEAKYLTDKNGQPLNKLEQWAAVGFSSIAPLGRRMIMFFNAAIQGLNATYQLWKKNKLRSIGWVSGYIAIGALNAVLHALMDDDDDYLDIPQYERRNSLMIGGNGAYFKWALPQEARAFYALGDLAVESVMGRNPHQSVIGEALKISTEILPINPSEGWKAFMPSVAIPLVELALNEDYKGAPIYNEQKWLTEEEKKRSTKWSKAYSGTGDLYIGIAKVLNAVTGGDEHDAGLVNLQPEKIEHIVQSAFGGTIRTADKFINTIMAAFDPEEDVTIRQLPFLNRILTINDERYKNVHVNDVYDYYAAEAEHAISLQKQYTKDRNSDALKDLRSSEEYKWARIYSKYKKPIKKYQEAIRAADTTNERMELMKQQDELKRKMIKEISEL